MKSILVDTHAFLWFVFDDPRLSKRADEVLGHPGITKVISVVSLWEIAVKVSISKLKLGLEYAEFLERYVEGRQVELLQIRLQHLSSYVQLPLHHRDPFDRLLIAQSQVEGLTVLTSDDKFSRYSVPILW